MNLFGRGLDALIESVAPRLALSRARARFVLDRVRGYADSGNKSLVNTLKDLVTRDGSASAVLRSDLGTVRKRARHAYEHTGSAVAVIEGLVGLVVSSGIDIEPDTGDLNRDAAYKDAWLDLLDRLDYSGYGDGWEIQRLAFRSQCLSGDGLFQVFYPSDYLTDGEIPLAILALESDQLADEPVAPMAKGNEFRNGVEVDAFLRPQAYHIQAHPGDVTALMGTAAARTQSRRVPAAEIIHCFERLRPGQTRGWPVLAPILTRMLQDDDLVRYELESARSASIWGVALTGMPPGGLGGGVGGLAVEGATETDAAGNKEVLSQAGDILQFANSEKAEVLANPRPTQAIMPFRDGLRGDYAGACRLNQSWIDRDNTRANFSSMNAGKSQDRRLVVPVQGHFGFQFVRKLYRLALPWIAASSGYPLPARGAGLRAARRAVLQPDGLDLADPTRENRASLDAIFGGLSNWQTECAKRGGNMREIHRQLAKEMTSPLGQLLLTLAKSLPPPAADANANTQDELMQEVAADA